MYAQMKRGGAVASTCRLAVLTHFSNLAWHRPLKRGKTRIAYPSVTECRSRSQTALCILQKESIFKELGFAVK